MLLSGLATLTLAGIRFTPVFDALAAWMQGLSEAFVVALAVLAGGALVLLAWRAPRRRAEPTDRSFPDLNPHPVLEIDADGAICFRNAAAAALFPDLDRQGMAHPLLHEVPALLAGLRHGKRRHIVREVEVGSSVYEQRIVRVPGADRARIYLVDITKRRHAAEARQQSEQKFARVFRSAPMAISISRLSDGRYIDVNDSFVRLLGYEDRLAIVGRTAPELNLWVQGTERARMLALLSHSDAAVHSLEAQLRRRDGTLRDVIMSLELMEFDGEACVLSTMLDVTERNQAEAGIAVLKAFYENTLRELPVQVAVLDPEARFFYLNPEAMPDEEMRHWMVGKTSVDFALAQGLDPAPYERRHQWLLDVIARKEIGQLEETLTSHDGQERHLLRVATPVLDDGEVLYVVGYGIDITERKLSEHKLLEAKDAAEEMARLKSAFVANMSHEIRTPLTAIMGFATVLGEELDGEHRELVEIIKQSGERLLETLNSVLDLARLEANAIDVDPRPLDLGEELLAAARLFKPMAQKKGLAFKVETPGRKTHAQLDRACLHRVLSNLLSNAVKFTDEGEVRLVLRSAGSEVQIEVRDTGIGIDAAFLPHLFDEFKQESTGLARTHTGSGLGLAITRHLIERMHGRIEVQSTKGEGSTFLVTFPAMTAPPVGRADPPARPEPHALHPGPQTVGS